MTYTAYTHLEAVTETQRTIRYIIPMSKYFTAKRDSRLLTQVILKYAKGCGDFAKENSQGSLRKEGDKWKFSYGGGTPGEEDVTYYKDGKTYALEIKIGRDVQSEVQKKYQQRMQQVGVQYHIIKTFDDLLEILKSK